MKTTFTTRHIEMESDDIIKGHFEDRAGKLGKYLKRFRDDLIYLHGTLERNPHKDEFYATLSLFLPTTALHCRERGQDYASALNLAFLDIARQIDKPTPMPAALLVTNGINNLSRTVSEMPEPVSLTAISIMSLPALLDVMINSRRGISAIASTALRTKLTSTC